MSTRTLYERVEEIGGYKFIRLKSGRKLTFTDAITASERAFTTLTTAISRSSKLAGEEDWDLQRLEWQLDKIEEWLRAIRAHLEKLHGIRSKKERIAMLRNTRGRTPEEAAMYRRKADELAQEIEA